jgi:hypothetical protein
VKVNAKAVVYQPSHVPLAIAAKPAVRIRKAHLAVLIRRVRKRSYPCAVGQIIISFTSRSAGCSIANAMARAIASGGIANLSRDSASWAFTSGFVTPSAKFVRTKPGEMIVTRSLSPASYPANAPLSMAHSSWSFWRMNPVSGVTNCLTAQPNSFAQMSRASLVSAFDLSSCGTHHRTTDQFEMPHSVRRGCNSPREEPTKSRTNAAISSAAVSSAK